MIRKSFLPSACLIFVVVCCFAHVAGAQGKPAAPCTTPGISFWKLLDAVSVGYTDGRLGVKPYGKYPFTVKGGQIQLQGRQVRDATDPMLYITDYLSGGRYTSWWIKRETSGR